MMGAVLRHLEGITGDAKLNFRYLLYNQMKGPGARGFYWYGSEIPSDNILTESSLD